MGYTKRDIRTFSMLGQQGSVGMALSQAKQEGDNLIVMSADLCSTSGLSRFQSAYPDSFVNVGIAEQNMLGVASGLAACGYKVFASSFSNFIAMRAVEFARSSVAYMDLDVKMIGIGAGFAMGQFGNTHYGIEDVAMMASIPGMMVVEPADGLEAAKAVEALLDYDGPAYLRLTGGPNAGIVYSEDYEFELGKSYVLREGRDAAIIGAGAILSEAMKAADALAEKGIEVEVVNMPTVNPVDEEAIARLAARYDCLFVLEEHGPRGFVSLIVEKLSSVGTSCMHVPICMHNSFVSPGTRDYLLEKNGLTAHEIERKVSECSGGEK